MYHSCAATRAVTVRWQITDAQGAEVGTGEGDSAEITWNFEKFLVDEEVLGTGAMWLAEAARENGLNF